MDSLLNYNLSNSGQSNFNRTAILLSVIPQLAEILTEEHKPSYLIIDQSLIIMI